MKLPILVALLGFLAVPGTAYAYLDPATGSVLVQGLIGAIAAASVFFDRIRSAVRRLLSRKQRGEPTATD